jgi:hypothetical protein
MTIQSNFRPKQGAGQIASPAVGSAVLTIGAGSRTLRVKNTGATNPMSVRTGLASDGTLTAVVNTDLTIYPGEVVYIEKDPRHDTLAHVSTAGTTLHVIPGEGGVGSGN